jgi:hypothetical protein
VCCRPAMRWRADQCSIDRIEPPGGRIRNRLYRTQ